MKKGFTLIEIVFVLIIIGILASLGSDILFQAYQSYIISKNVNNSAHKSDVAIEVIAKRLSHRIPYTETLVSEFDITDMQTLSFTNPYQYKILQWIGNVYESFIGEWDGGYFVPSHSGFIDLDSPSTNKASFLTPGSKLSKTVDLVATLYGRDLNSTLNGCVVLFPSPFSNTNIISDYFSGSGAASNYLVYAGGEETFNFTNALTQKELYEHYYLACSAYALVPQENGSRVDLYLYYDYRPWLGETYLNGKKTLLVNNLTKFNFRRKDRAIELKLCASEGIGEYNATFCSAKVVF
ncbi:MAG: type II secretion system protein [Epsilonproteobacteria bacterium]|nr:type II secretion system protein [Campylobacterota bacterium]